MQLLHPAARAKASPCGGLHLAHTDQLPSGFLQTQSSASARDPLLHENHMLTSFIRYAWDRAAISSLEILRTDLSDRFVHL